MNRLKCFTKVVMMLAAFVLIFQAAACAGINGSATDSIREIQPTYINQLETPNILLITAVTVPTRPAGQYPADAEGVVIAFLTAYQSDQEGMTQYLSKALQKKVPEGGPGLMLRFRDLLEGYAVKAAAVSQEPPAAVITVAVKSGWHRRQHPKIHPCPGRWQVGNYGH